MIGFTIPDTIPPSYSPVWVFFLPISFSPTFLTKGLILSIKTGITSFLINPAIIGAITPPVNIAFIILANLLSFFPVIFSRSLFIAQVSNLSNIFPINVSCSCCFSLYFLTLSNLPLTEFLIPVFNVPVILSPNNLLPSVSFEFILYPIEPKRPPLFLY